MSTRWRCVRARLLVPEQMLIVIATAAKGYGGLSGRRVKLVVMLSRTGIPTMAK